MAPVRAALTEKVDQIAAQLIEAGLIHDPLVDEPFRTRLAKLFEGLDGEHFLTYGRSWRDRFPGYYTLMSNPKILDAVESLIGPELFANPVYNVRPKVPRVAAGAVPWHQDKSYWPDANSNPVITVWISFVDATLENGCLHVLPRTQRTRVMDFHQEEYSGTGFLEVDEKHLRLLTSGKARALAVKAGTAILFNDRLVHSLHAEQLRPRAVECRPQIPADRPGPDAPARSRFPCPEPTASRAGGDARGLACRPAGAPAVVAVGSGRES